MKYHKDTVVAEIAGRDSIAALISYSRANPGSKILPTVAVIPPEEDRHDEIVKYLEELQTYIHSIGSYMYDPLYIDSTISWWKIQKNVDELSTKYGFFTYCLGCHGVVHAVRIPIARLLSGMIITGERHRHGKREKINQSLPVIDAYRKMFDDNGVDHIAPILGIELAEDIDKIMREFEDNYMSHDPGAIGCHISGNAMGLGDSTPGLEQYLHEYMVPKLQEIIDDMEEEKWALKMLDS